ncbi:uncharacterized protein [Anabrus simplex]
MEVPFLVKCEPSWQSDREEPCCTDPSGDSGDNCKVKVEAEKFLTDPKVEEVEEVIVKEEHDNEDMMVETHEQQCGTSDVPVYE